MQLDQGCCSAKLGIWTYIREILAPIQPPSIADGKFRGWWKSHANTSRLRALSNFEWCHTHQISIAMAGKMEWKRYQDFIVAAVFWCPEEAANHLKRYEEMLAAGNEAVQDAIADGKFCRPRPGV